MGRRELSRLQACMKVLRDNAEQFVRIGLALAEINTDQLFREEGFEDFASFVAAHKEEFGFGSVRRAYQLMKAARYRASLPEVPCEGVLHSSWSESSVAPLTQLDTPEEAAKVAKKAIKTAKKAGKKLTAKIVKEAVNEELGIESVASEDSPTDIFDGLIGSLQGFFSGPYAAIDEEAIRHLVKTRRATARELAQAIEAVEKRLEWIWALLP